VYFRNQPLGCTSTIIYQMYLEKGITITSQMAGLMCAAILSDTLMFRSPTCTQIDREAALRLAEIAEVKVEELASAMFQAGSNFDNKTEEEILNQDFKIFHAGDVSFGVAQISAMGRTELDKVQERIEPKLEQMMGEKQIQMIFVMLTDILNESTYLIYRGADASQLVAAAYNCEPSDQGIMLENVVSRKKQLIPALINTLAERKM
jgi:manganese-dependent inorganic pyrophosphatase